MSFSRVIPAIQAGFRPVSQSREDKPAFTAVIPPANARFCHFGTKFLTKLQSYLPLTAHLSKKDASSACFVLLLGSAAFGFIPDSAHYPPAPQTYRRTRE